MSSIIAVVENHFSCIIIIMVLGLWLALAIYIIWDHIKQKKKDQDKYFDCIQIAGMINVAEILTAGKKNLLTRPDLMTEESVKSILDTAIPRYLKVVPEKIRCMCLIDIDFITELCTEFLEKASQVKEEKAPEPEKEKTHRVGSYDWAKNVSKEELENWMDNDADPNDPEHIMTFGVISGILGKSTEEIVDRVIRS